MRPVRRVLGAGVVIAGLLVAVEIGGVSAPESAPATQPTGKSRVTSADLKAAEGRGPRQTLPDGHRQALLDKGYSESDIAQAEDLAWRYMWSIDHLLQWHRNDTSWETIASILQSQALVPKPEFDKLMPLEFGPDGQIRSAERTWSGMTRAEVVELNRTYTLEEIQKADSLAVALKVKAADLLALLRREGNWSKVLTAVEEAGHPKDSGGTARVKLIPGQRSKSGLSEEQLNALVEQGYGAEDVMLADTYAALTASTPEQALKLRQTGLTWPDVLRQLRAQSEIVPGTKLTESQFGALEAKGYDRSDIATAASISAVTGQTPEEVLQLRGQQPWSEYIKALVESNPKARVVFSKPPELQLGNTTKEEAHRLLGQGYSPQDVVIADGLSPVLARSATQILADKGEMEWEEFTKRLAETDHAANEKLRSLASPADPQPVPNRSGMTEGEYRSFVARGYSHSSIEAADFYAAKHGVSVSELLKMSETTTWDEIGKTLAERAWLEKTGEAEKAKWRAKGFTESDFRQAEEISRVTGQSYQTILEMKTPNRTWLEIAEELKPGATPPVHQKGEKH